MNGARAMRSLPRSGSRGLSGRRSLTWSTPANAGVAAARRATTRRAARARLRSTGRLTRALRVRRVELREPSVVATDVVVVRIQLERALVLGERAGEVSVRLEGHGEVVVSVRVLGLLRDRLLVSEGGLAPEALLRDRGAERELCRRPIRVLERRACRRDKN